MNNTSPKYPIKVLNKALDVLEVLLEHKSISMTQISEELHLYPSTIHRILDTLRCGGYVEQDPITQKYQLGLKLLELGMAKLQQIDLIKEATPYLKELVKSCNETVHLGVLDGTSVLYLAKEESAQTIRMISYVGRRAPLHCTSLGKVLLANLSTNERDIMLDNIELIKLTENTITDKQELLNELHKIEQQGFALDREEYEKDVSCIAAPIRDHRGKVVAAVSISVPSYRVNKGINNCLLKEKGRLTFTCQMISHKLGFDSKKISTSF